MKSILTIILLISFSFYAKCQNPPVVEKAAPQSNNTLPSGGTLGSQSGVNPMGNPGTIANSSASGSAVNNAIAPHPNADPGVYLTSSPEGTVINTTETNSGVTTRAASTVANSGTVTAVVAEPSKAPAPVKSSNEINKPSTAPVKSNTAVVKEKVSPTKVNTAVTTEKTKTIPAYTPVMGNYVSEQTISKIKSKYGSNVYDIRTVRLASTHKVAYLVRLLEDGKLRSELYSEEQ